MATAFSFNRGRTLTRTLAGFAAPLIIPSVAGFETHSLHSFFTLYCKCSRAVRPWLGELLNATRVDLS